MWETRPRFGDGGVGCCSFLGIVRSVGRSVRRSVGRSKNGRANSQALRREIDRAVGGRTSSARFKREGRGGGSWYWSSRSTTLGRSMDRPVLRKHTVTYRKRKKKGQERNANIPPPSLAPSLPPPPTTFTPFSTPNRPMHLAREDQPARVIHARAHRPFFPYFIFTLIRSLAPSHVFRNKIIRN